VAAAARRARAANRRPRWGCYIPGIESSGRCVSGSWVLAGYWDHFSVMGGYLSCHNTWPQPVQDPSSHHALSPPCTRPPLRPPGQGCSLSLSVFLLARPLTFPAFPCSPSLSLPPPSLAHPPPLTSPAFPCSPALPLPHFFFLLTLPFGPSFSACFPAQVKVRQTSPKRGASRAALSRPPAGPRAGASRSALAASSAKSTLPLDKGVRSFAKSSSTGKLSDHGGRR
jgi:hypothetical protein